jgi:hypothetical protein
MNRRHLSVFLVILSGWPLRYGLAEQGIPKLALFPTPFEQHAVPFSKALEEIGTRTQSGYVLFGVEIREKEAREPTVDLEVPEGATLSDALRAVLRQMPGYTLEIVSDRMIDIYPQGAKDDPKDPLNLRVQRFDFVDDHVDTLLNHPQAYILELAKRLVERNNGPPYPIEYPSVMAFSALEPPITLHLHDVTVREILNVASEATQAFPANLSLLCWSSQFHPDPVWAVGGTYSWRAFTCSPRDWKEHSKPAAKSAPPRR